MGLLVTSTLSDPEDDEDANMIEHRLHREHLYQFSLDGHILGILPFLGFGPRNFLILRPGKVKSGDLISAKEMAAVCDDEAVIEKPQKDRSTTLNNAEKIIPGIDDKIITNKLVGNDVDFEPCTSQKATMPLKEVGKVDDKVKSLCEAQMIDSGGIDDHWHVVMCDGYGAFICAQLKDAL